MVGTRAAPEEKSKGGAAARKRGNNMLIQKAMKPGRHASKKGWRNGENIPSQYRVTICMVKTSR